MSYGKFLDEMSDEIGRLESLDRKTGIPEISDARHEELMEQAHRIVFDRWIAQERFGELISYIHSNFASGQGDEWLYPLSALLQEKHRVPELKRLWRGVISMRSQSFWDVKRPPSKRMTETLEKLGVEVPKYSNEEISEQKKYTLEAMHALLAALEVSGDDEAVEKLRFEIGLFEIEKRPSKLKTTDKRKIDQTLFWRLIEDCRSSTASNPEFIDDLRMRLEQFSPTEIRKFKKFVFEKSEELKSWDLWALAYIVRRGCSDDAFDYFRAWVVGQGKLAVELAKTDLLKFANFRLFRRGSPTRRLAIRRRPGLRVT